MLNLQKTVNKNELICEFTIYTLFQYFIIYTMIDTIYMIYYGKHFTINNFWNLMFIYFLHPLIHLCFQYTPFYVSVISAVLLVWLMNKCAEFQL